MLAGLSEEEGYYQLLLVVLLVVEGCLLKTMKLVVVGKAWVGQ